MISAWSSTLEITLTYIYPASMSNTSLESFLKAAKDQVIHWCEIYQIPDDHGADHAFKVLHHGRRAISDFKLNDEETICVLLACLLHDIDDRKYTPSKDYKGARMIMEDIGFLATYGQKLADFVIHLISLVSCSKNGNDINTDHPTWYYIPRDADRLEALGYVGIQRAYDTTNQRNARVSVQTPYFTDETVRCRSIEELSKYATPDRLIEYMKTGESNSLVDHFYDKILHIHKMVSRSTTLQTVANQRHVIMVNFVLEFGQTGQIDWAKWLERV